MTNDHRLLSLTDKDIHLLKVFDTVVKAGGYTAAEACLNKSKSAISIQISALEARLGKTLCYRGRSGFSLSPEGEQVYQICKEMFSEIDGFRERLNRVSPLLGGTLKVAIDDNLSSRLHILAAGFGQFKNGTDSTFLELSIVSPERLFQLLIDGEVDIGVGSIPREIPEAKMFTLYQEDLVWFCSSKHPLFAKRDSKITSSELEGYESVDFWAYQAPEFKGVAESLRNTARTSQAMGRLLLLLSGKWIGLLSREFAAPWVAAGQLAEIQLKTELQRKCYLTVRSEVAAYSSCARLVRELRRAFENEADMTAEAYTKVFATAS